MLSRGIEHMHPTCREGGNKKIRKMVDAIDRSHASNMLYAGYCMLYACMNVCYCMLSRGMEAWLVY